MSDKQQIYELMPKIMKDIGAIEKKDTNAHQKYQYRSIEDTLAACQPVFIKHKITLVPTVSMTQYDSNGIAATYSLQFIAPDGSSVKASTFVAGAPPSKGFQASGAAYSYAHKELIFKTFSVPVQQEDGDRLEPAKNGKSKAFKVPTAKQLEAMTLDELRALYPLAKSNGASNDQLNRIALAGEKKRESEVKPI